MGENVDFMPLTVDYQEKYAAMGRFPGGFFELMTKKFGITDIVLSRENEKDVLDIEPQYIAGLNFHYFTDMIDAVKFNLDWK